MAEEGAQGLGTVLQLSEGPARQSAHLLDAAGRGVEHHLLHHCIALLLGIQVRGVGGKELEAEVLGVASDEVEHLARAMSVEPIENDGERTAYLLV